MEGSSYSSMGGVDPTASASLSSGVSAAHAVPIGGVGDCPLATVHRFQDIPPPPS